MFDALTRAKAIWKPKIAISARKIMFQSPFCFGFHIKFPANSPPNVATLVFILERAKTIRSVHMVLKCSKLAHSRGLCQFGAWLLTSQRNAGCCSSQRNAPPTASLPEGAPKSPSEAKSGSQSPGGDPLSPSLSIFLLVLNVGNGWVAGGCWDDYETSDDLWIIPENSLRKTHQ